MIIDKKFLDRRAWWEDCDGNVIEVPDDGIGDDVANELIKSGITYHSCFPLEITEHIYNYCWKPKTKLQKFLCKSKTLYRILEKKHHTEKTYNHMFDVNYNIGDEDVIMAMVNSGDYTLSQALMLWSQSCERCMNVLAFKYLDGKDGYPEHSNEWKKCNTVCRFCEKE